MARSIPDWVTATGCRHAKAVYFLHNGVASCKIFHRLSNQEEAIPPNWTTLWNCLHTLAVTCYTACRCLFLLPGNTMLNCQLSNVPGVNIMPALPSHGMALLPSSSVMVTWLEPLSTAMACALHVIP